MAESTIPLPGAYDIALAQLRHLYAHLKNGTFTDAADLADGLLSPQIAAFERLNGRPCDCGDVARRTLAARAPAIAQGQGDGWRPIETAPMDGSEVLLALPVWGSGPSLSVTVGSYHHGLWLQDDGVARHELYPPTHWMPLPPAPAQQEPGR